MTRTIIVIVTILVLHIGYNLYASASTLLLDRNQQIENILNQ